MSNRLPNKFVTILIALGCLAFAFPTPPPFPPDLGQDPGNPQHPTEPTTEEPRQNETTPVSSLSGKDVYIKECAICHGQTGEGTERGTPIKKPYKVFATHITRHGRKGNPQYAIPMPAYPEATIPNRQLVQIWSYLDGVELPSTGKDIYQTYCANCHGVDGLGGMSSQPLINTVGITTQPELFALWVRWGQDDGFYDSRTTYMPRWNQAEISDADLEKLRSYVQSLPSASELNYVP